MRDWLRDIRTSLNLTQTEVAEKAGLTQAYYAQIENGVRGEKLPVTTAQSIAIALGFDWTDFYKSDKEAK